MQKVMVVDDEETTRDLLAQVIRLLGHEPVQAAGGAQAVERFQASPPDLILMDLMMPEMDGYEAMRRIRGLNDGARVPIVVITASQEVDVEERVADSGGDEVYYKPIGLNTISEIIASFAHTPRLAERSPTRISQTGRRWAH